jgi:hypothetical protein
MKIRRRVVDEGEILFSSTNFGDVLSNCITNFFMGVDLGGVWFLYTMIFVFNGNEYSLCHVP